MGCRFDERRSQAAPMPGFALSMSQPQFVWRPQPTPLQSRPPAPQPPQSTESLISTPPPSPLGRPLGPGTATGHPEAPPAASWHNDLDDWLAIPTYWMPPSPTTARYTTMDLNSDRGRRVARSIMVAMAIATVATGSLLSSSLASPSLPPMSEPSPEAAHGAASGHGESHRYTVRAGDTIADIAAWLGLPTTVLIAANDLPDPNFILPGQQLTIPAADQADEAGQDEERAATGGLVIPVEAGDTIWGLSRRYEVDLNQIISYPENHITNPNRILPGQPLVITGAHEPTAPTSDQAGADDTSPYADQNDASATPPPSPEATEATPAPTPTPTSAPPAPAPSTSQFAWPVQGKMTQPFGPTSLAAEPADQGHAHFHQGIDLANRLGTPITAAGDGTVTFAGWSTAGYGYCVQILHGNGLVTLYGHLANEPAVQVGQRVTQGQEIGQMGSTGNSTGPHLHFAVLDGNTWVDPMQHLP